jgi:uncharacterized protein (DUF427 family)
VAICVYRKSDGGLILRGEEPSEIIRLEGNYYFHPDVVDTSLMDITQRTYACQKKGICNWIDLKTNKGFVIDASWVYPDPKTGYENIRGWYGFYPDHRYYKTEECE